MQTALAVLASRRLKAAKEAVASVFVDSAVDSDEHAFLEDLLTSVYHQLGEKKGFADNTFDLYEQYDDACTAGDRVARRIALIQETLYARLACLSQSDIRAFLVFDGFDRCSIPLRLLLERDLSALQDRSLRILLTTRLPIFEQQQDYYCDGEDHGPQAPLQEAFVECKSHEDLVLCLACKEKLAMCAQWCVAPSWLPDRCPP